MVAGPEMSRILAEFETEFLSQKENDITHHEETQAVQSTFAKQVTSLVVTLQTMGNPFLEKGSDTSLTLERHSQFSLVETVRKIEETGGTHYD